MPGSRNLWILLRRLDRSAVSHCQTVSAVHPRSRSSASTFRSRCRFAENLLCQNSVLVLGTVARWHPSCPCQKQPWTKMTFRRDGNTMSGEPGSFRTCNMYRYPNAKVVRLTTSSGCVLACRTLLIWRLRCSGDIRSTKVSTLSRTTKHTLCSFCRLSSTSPTDSRICAGRLLRLKVLVPRPLKLIWDFQRRIVIKRHGRGQFAPE